MAQHVEDRHGRENLSLSGRPVGTDCPFCRIVEGTAPARVLREWVDALAIVPRGGGVTAGHVLVLPKTHVPDIAADPSVSAATMRCTAELAAEVGDCNVITSRGAAATQTVPHLHVHLVPRTRGDGILLPWTAEDGGGRPGRGRRPWTARPLNPGASGPPR
ncbi:HIT family protein [Streptomyces spongiae]|uniref:HIT domain-containing protein n=1 Tax=Streptomyces spongiae TaxID=565072 RepID=A0A5N8XD84_9ACTN|nr:HIT domain-containing protein [Streptomyces spongiae]MPY57493.1 HIT domain-containing protein [Streptomyces spongiae]